MHALLATCIKQSVKTYILRQWKIAKTNTRSCSFGIARLLIAKQTYNANKFYYSIIFTVYLVRMVVKYVGTHN